MFELKPQLPQLISPAAAAVVVVVAAVTVVDAVTVAAAAAVVIVASEFLHCYLIVALFVPFSVSFFPTIFLLHS